MEALAGFAGNKVRTEFQVARVLRRTQQRKDGDGVNVMGLSPGRKSRAFAVARSPASRLRFEDKLRI
jgi:hypothetical protein